MIDYFLDAEDARLVAMGVDRRKLPAREAWLESVLLDHERIDAHKERAYLGWIYDGELVGHSSINKIRPGEEAYIHLHLWNGELRQAGLGTQYFKASVSEFMRVFGLRRLYCEPYADNPAPNRVLAKAGFQFVRRYRTVPGAINFEQDVNRYVLAGSLPGAGVRWEATNG